MQNDLDNICMTRSIACVEINHEKLFIVKLSYLMPFLIPIFSPIVKLFIIIVKIFRKYFPSLMKNKEFHPAFWIIDKVEETVKERINSGKRRMDLIQLMLDASTQDQDQVTLFNLIIYFIRLIYLF